MSDFSPDIRNAAWWATDSRRAVSGKLSDVVLEKRGIKPMDDLSDVEEVQMGKVLQPAIGQLFEDVTGITCRELDLAKTHPREDWLRSHTDFETGDGGLLEVKNYNAGAITKYGDMDDPWRGPEADYIQCLHEACVWDVPHVWFCALFGGQRLRYWKLTFTQDQKDAFVRQAAAWWALCRTDAPLTPETPAQARLIYPQDKGGVVLASARDEQVAGTLRAIKAQMKQLAEQEDVCVAHLQAVMGTGAELQGPDGSILATWKTAKASKRFSAELLKSSMPDIYQKFTVEQPGSRRFLLK